MSIKSKYYFIYIESIDSIHWTKGSLVSSEYSTSRQVRFFLRSHAPCILLRYWETWEAEQLVNLAISPDGKLSVRNSRYIISSLQSDASAPKTSDISIIISSFSNISFWISVRFCIFRFITLSFYEIIKWKQIKK